MCQYSSNNGCPSNWHYHHLRNLIMSGAGSIVIESTAVSKIGRITEKDLCLFNQKHYNGHKRLIKNLKKIRNIPIILQISHSGRKGSSEVPWIKKNLTLKKKGWTTIAPSAISRGKNFPIPKKMNLKDIKKVINEFKKTAKLAFKAGYDGIEIHMAHGYLIHQFCSPISNIRNDEYSHKNFKFPLEILNQLKKIRPINKIIGARITGTDHLKNGLRTEDAINLVNKIKKNGLDYICVSSGGIIPITNMKFFKGFRIKIAKKIKKYCNIKTRTSGLINDSKTLKKVLNTKELDFVALGRVLIKRKYFLVEEKVIKKDEIEPQYKYCV